jgi:hypothetical protein
MAKKSRSKSSGPRLPSGRLQGDGEQTSIRGCRPTVAKIFSMLGRDVEGKAPTHELHMPTLVVCMEAVYGDEAYWNAESSLGDAEKGRIPKGPRIKEDEATGMLTLAPE